MKYRKKILFVSYSFYPVNSPNAYRWLPILCEWAESGVQVIVVTAQTPHSLKNKYEEYQGIIIYRTGISFFQKMKTKFGRYSNEELNTNNGNKPYKEKLLRKIYNNTWKKYCWPDWAFLSYSPVLRLSRQILKKEKIDAIITVSWPFTDHLIGYKLKKEFNKFWLAETIDPFSFNEEINNQRLYSKLNNYVERKVLNNADHITVMTARIRDKYISLFPEISSKIEITHNVFVPQNDKIQMCERREIVNTIRLVFVGTLSAKNRNPDILLRIFEMIKTFDLKKNYELHFYGNIKSDIHSFNKYNDYLGKSIFVHGYVERNQIFSILEDADVLLNIGNSNPYQEPSKIIEYVYLGKPVINVCSIMDDSSKEILDKYPLTFNFNKQDLDDMSKVKELLVFINTKKHISKDVSLEIIKPYLLNEVIFKYNNILFNN